MFLKLKISCCCACEYSVSNNASTTKIVCPNCGKEYPHSDKLLSILKLSNDIPDGDLLSNECAISAISFHEDMTKSQ